MDREILVVSDDAVSLRILRQVLEGLPFAASYHHNCELAAEEAAHRRFDAMLIDGADLRGGPEFLLQVRTMPANRGTVLLAMVRGQKDSQAAMYLGANFVLRKPLSLTETRRALHVARGLMSAERRRSTRKPAQFVAHFSVLGMHDFPAVVVDLSETGMAVHSLLPLARGREGEVRFVLPGSDDTVRAKAKVIWADDFGRAGVRFDHIRPDDRIHLARWLRVKGGSA